MRNGIGACRGLSLAAAAVVVCLTGPAQAQGYKVEKADIPGQPGTIIRIWPQPGGGPGNSEAFRILYRSTAPGGEAIAVSGAIFFPAGPAPVQGRPVVAWAHPTSGVVYRCAPSLRPELDNTVQGLGQMLEAGFVVVATDYPGLGTPGIHPYLIGESEARSVLDSVRAARNIPQAKAQDRFIVWGHSQGGHAALYTGLLAAGYTPELKLLGVAAAAPATELAALFNSDFATLDGKILTSMALWSWSHLFKQPLDGVIYPDIRGAFERTAQDCIEDLKDWLNLEKAAQPLETEFLKINPTKTEPWKGIMARNTPAAKSPGAPLFIAQGTADTTVRPQITDNYVEQLCHSGATVAYLSMPGVNHIRAAQNSAFDAVNWMKARFQGRPAPTSCQR